MSLDEETLELVAKDGEMDYEKWPGILEPLLARLDQIVHSDFPVPSYPSHDLWELHFPGKEATSQVKSETSSQLPSNADVLPDTNITSPRALPPVPPFNSSASATTHIPDSVPLSQALATETIPELLLQQLTSINHTLRTCFAQNPPHTIQRLAELVISPTRSYKTLPAWLRAVDRVVSVSSTADIFPLPIAQPLPGSVIDTGLVNGSINGIGNGTVGGGILWTSSAHNSHDTTLGSDESLGGALLTPIPWLKNGIENAGMSSPRSDLLGDPLIDEPGNAMVPERENGAVTQGELIRLEQEAGVVPVTQNIAARNLRDHAEEGEDDVRPHARGPGLVGAVDMGMVDGRVVEAQIGRDVREPPPTTTTTRESDAEVAGAGRTEEQEQTPNAAAVAAQAEVEAETGTDGDIVLTDADGNNDEERGTMGADVSGENVGPDAVDTSGI